MTVARDNNGRMRPSCCCCCWRLLLLLLLLPCIAWY